jgi:hypothetical protein
MYGIPDSLFLKRRGDPRTHLALVVPNVHGELLLRIGQLFHLRLKHTKLLRLIGPYGKAIVNEPQIADALIDEDPFSIELMITSRKTDFKLLRQNLRNCDFPPA